MIPRHNQHPPDEVMMRQYDPKSIRYTGRGLITRTRDAVRIVTGIDPLFKITDGHKEYIKSRQLFMYFYKAYSGKTQSAVGKVIGKDHTTVLNGIKKVRNYCENEPAFKKDFDEIEKRIKYLK